MINVAIELVDDNIDGVDLSHPEKGNPGIGGSEWLFVLLAQQLKNNYADKYHVTLYHKKNQTIPANIKSIIYRDEDELISLLKENEEMIFIHQINRNLEWYKKIEEVAIADIPWAHCYIKYPEVDAIANCNSVKRVVFVGKEEYDSYFDDDIIEKSTFIYNMIPEAYHGLTRQKVPYGRKVLYMGSLVRGKSFHYLARIWPKVLKKIPDAELLVAGTGKLYNKDAILGEYGIAEDEYEKTFIRYLIDDNGDIIPSVTFLGIVGDDKSDIMKEIRVGVVNPLGKDETFCLSAVEMEAFGIPVVTCAKYGILDTVKHNYTGLLFHYPRGFVNNICKLLSEDDFNVQLGLNAMEYVKRFSIKKQIEEWDNLLIDIVDNAEVVLIPPSGNYANDMKWVRIMNRYIRFKLKLRVIPSVNRTKYTIKRTWIKYGKKLFN